MDPIQVLGQQDVRKEVQFKDGSGQLLVDKARVKNTLAGDVLEEALRKYHLKTFTGQKGTFVLANTAGYHRKGAHNISRPRITLNFEVKRKGILSKFLINVFALIKFKITRSQLN